MNQAALFLMCCFSCVVVNPHPWGHRIRARSYRHRDKRNNSLTKTTSCEERFITNIHECMDPFSRKVHHYTQSKSEDPFVQKVFVNHACRQYKKMLLCIHTSLTNCPTKENMETVQEKLGQSWVSEVNSMCNVNIQSNSSSQTYHKSTPNSNALSSSENVKHLARTSYPNVGRIATTRNSTQDVNKSADNTDRSHSAKLSKQVIDRPSKDGYGTRTSGEVLQIPATFLQFHDKEPDLVILFNPQGQHSNTRTLPTQTSNLRRKYSELDTNKNSPPRLLRWLYIVINASNLNTLQVGISSPIKTTEDIGRRSPDPELLRSAAKTVWIGRIQSWQLLMMIITVIYVSS